MDDNERNWTRILEAVRVLSKAHGVEIPDGLIVNTGSIWERYAQRRTALNEFLSQIEDMPEFPADGSLDDIADRLDQVALELEKAEIDEPDV